MSRSALARRTCRAETADMGCFAKGCLGAIAVIVWFYVLLAVWVSSGPAGATVVGVLTLSLLVMWALYSSGTTATRRLSSAMKGSTSCRLRPPA